MRKVIISISIILIIWVMISIVFHPAEYLFPSLKNVIKEFINNYKTFFNNALYTILEVIAGFAIANIMGLFLALIVIHYKHLEQTITIMAIILKTVPIIAIAPLLVLWFGHGMGSKIAAVTITCFIPVLINVLTGAKEVLLKYNNLIDLYNLNKIQETKYFLLPGIMPYLMSALKISSSLAIVGALVSELISANKGLGYLIISNYYSMNIAAVFACIIISSIIGIVIYYIFDIMELSEQHSERELERALVDNIKDFLGEMGGNFAFMGNQYHLNVDGNDFYIDLLLYHRSLKSLVAIELKIGEFKPEYVGQLQFYLTVLDKQVKMESENPSIGIIICKEKNRTVVEYALSNSDKPIGVATYKIHDSLPEQMKDLLPSPEEIKKRLEGLDNEN